MYSFDALKRKIKHIYNEAYYDMERKAEEFAQMHAVEERRLRQSMVDGKLAKEDFEKWMKDEVFLEDLWEQKKRQMMETVWHADQVAQQMINGERFEMFAEGHNQFAYELSKDAGMMLSFTLYDADTVRRLMKDNPDLLPPKKKVGKDKSYKWYNKRIQSVALQGILQGETIPQIARRIAKETGESASAAMLRNARTMQTSAQNAGRLEGMHRAQDMGIKLKKMWIATLDGRTRDSHRDLDGQTQDIDKPFDSPLGDIMFPGDPDAAPGNVWNCRCTLGNSYMEYPYDILKRRDNETREFVENMTYRQWEAMKAGEGEQEKQQPTNIYGNTIQFHDGFDSPKGEECKAVILKLADEFKTKLQDVRRGRKGEAANIVEFDGKEMYLRQLRVDSAIHEFAHTITQKNQAKYGMVDDSEFWKEITKIRTQYRKHVREFPLEIISAYERAESSKIDEFFAEAFTLGYMRKNGIEIDDNFGKDTEFCIRVYNTALKYFGKHKRG